MLCPVRQREVCHVHDCEHEGASVLNCWMVKGRQEVCQACLPAGGHSMLCPYETKSCEFLLRSLLLFLLHLVDLVLNLLLHLCDHFLRDAHGRLHALLRNRRHFL